MEIQCRLGALRLGSFRKVKGKGLKVKGKGNLQMRKNADKYRGGVIYTNAFEKGLSLRHKTVRQFKNFIPLTSII